MINTHAPLAGIRVLVGRARHQASALVARLEALGADVIEIPFIEIRPPWSYAPLDSALRNIADYEWLVLTSVNGVDALSARMKKAQVSSQQLAHLKIAAIGPATQRAIQKLSLEVSVVPHKYIAEAVVEALREKVKGQRVLLARAKVARDVIPRELQKVGATVDVVEAYETMLPEESKKQLSTLIGEPRNRPHVITFTSSSTVRNFVALLGKHSDFIPHGIQFASIGPVTSSTLREFGLPVDVEAEEYTIDGLARAIATLFAGKQ